MRDEDLRVLMDLADQIEPALRTVPIRIGPNALRILEAGGTVVLSGGEYRDMALAAAAKALALIEGEDDG